MSTMGNLILWSSLTTLMDSPELATLKSEIFRDPTEESLVLFLSSALEEEEEELPAEVLQEALNDFVKTLFVIGLSQVKRMSVQAMEEKLLSSVKRLLGSEPLLRGKFSPSERRHRIPFGSEVRHSRRGSFPRLRYKDQPSP